ncbi:hypothetical protein EIP91_010017 [Steccherinum ochraceum]|uniref:Uncharacterized protein n=1 Tax=Steccherinum ochraceum TaxID=92696 RepID=A0A4R0R6F3_9APHY|nr:hypothetical protein EIP91_010017 [Steccherinum ochraceum]
MADTHTPSPLADFIFGGIGNEMQIVRSEAASTSSDRPDGFQTTGLDVQFPTSWNVQPTQFSGIESHNGVPGLVPSAEVAGPPLCLSPSSDMESGVVSLPGLPASSLPRRPLLLVPLTGYRILVLAVITAFGTVKTVLSLISGSSMAPTALDWISGVLCTAGLWWLGLYETVDPPIAAKFFHTDYAPAIFFVIYIFFVSTFTTFLAAAMWFGLCFTTFLITLFAMIGGVFVTNGSETSIFFGLSLPFIIVVGLTTSKLELRATSILRCCETAFASLFDLSITLHWEAVMIRFNLSAIHRVVVVSVTQAYATFPLMQNQ